MQSTLYLVGGKLKASSLGWEFEEDFHFLHLYLGLALDLEEKQKDTEIKGGSIGIFLSYLLFSGRNK